MNEEKKILLEGVFKNIMEREHPQFDRQKCKTLFSCWLMARRLPHTCELLGQKPPYGSTIRARLATDGYIWLKEKERLSFLRYAGYLKYVNE